MNDATNSALNTKSYGRSTVEWTPAEIYAGLCIAIRRQKDASVLVDALSALQRFVGEIYDGCPLRLSRIEADLLGLLRRCTEIPDDEAVFLWLKENGAHMPESMHPAADALAAARKAVATSKPSTHEETS